MASTTLPQVSVTFFRPSGRGPLGSGQDPQLVETMARWGFTWGGFWLVPDPMHFEYVRPPDAPG
jgi:hypothetical protein